MPAALSLGLPDSSQSTANICRMAEQVGFRRLWVMDNSPTSRPTSLDCLSVLSYAAGATTTIGLGTAVLIPTRYNPPLLARSLAAIDHLSSGRLTVGVGAGGYLADLESLGVHTRPAFPRFLECVEILRAIWAGGPASYSGNYYSFKDLEIQPPPHTPGGPPVWFGAAGPRALRATARYGNGWIGTARAGPTEFARQKDVILRELAAASRQRSAFSIAKIVPTAIVTSAIEGRRKMRNALDGYGLADISDEVSAVGTEAAVYERLKEFGDVDELIIRPMFDFSAQVEAMGGLCKMFSAPGAR